MNKSNHATRICNGEVCELTDDELDAVTGGSISQLIDDTIAAIKAGARELYCEWLNPLACQK
jgi:bacteriocin-like protein